MDDGFLMEVCVDSVESAVNAERGGKARGTPGRGRQRGGAGSDAPLRRCRADRAVRGPRGRRDHPEHG